MMAAQKTQRMTSRQPSQSLRLALLGLDMSVLTGGCHMGAGVATQGTSPSEPHASANQDSVMPVPKTNPAAHVATTATEPTTPSLATATFALG
jgi:hypothetical protein